MKRASFFSAGILGASALLANAAVTSLGSYTKATDGDESFSSVFNGGAQLFSYNSGDIYLAFEMTFSNPTTPGTLDTTQSYGGYSHSGGDLFGQLWEQSTVGVLYYGGRNDVAGVTINPGTPITMVVKYELNGPGVDGDTIKFWVDPVLGIGIEGAPDDADSGRIWNPAVISSDDMRFRMGNGSENEIEFANVTIYDNGDSPFVPEPSALALSVLGVLALLGRRQR